MIKLGAKILQPLVEPDRNKNKSTFKSMLKDKNPKYLKRTVDLIINWDRKKAHSSIIHIHGDKDKTIPTRNIKNAEIVKNGSHMMTLTRGEELNEIINEIIKN